MSSSPHTPPKHSAAKLGLIAGIFTYVVWGSYPIYFKNITQVPALEILAHRIVWSVPFGALIIALRGQWGAVFAAFRHSKTCRALIAASLFIAFNWGVYIWAVNNEQIFQASLGYYINPLFFVLVGVAFFGDKLHRLQMLAVALAVIGVVFLTFYGGEFPWIALLLALSFTVYGIIRKQVDVGAMPGLFIETTVLFIPALGYLVWLYVNGSAKFLSGNVALDILLLLAGPITVLPLLAFSFAARRLKLSTIGFLQFIGPTGQFLCGLYFGEPLTKAHLVCFGFIWLAVGFFVLGAMQTSKANRKAARKPSTGPG